MKKVVLIFALAFAIVPAFAESSVVEEDFGNCHTYACQVAEQGAKLGADVDDIYEMAYEDCTSN